MFKYIFNRIIYLLSLFILLFSFTACNNNSTSGNSLSIVADSDPPTPSLPILYPPDIFDDGSDSWFTDKTPTLRWNESIVTSPRVLSHYEISLGTSNGANDVLEWTNVGTVTSYRLTGLSLQRGNSYYASIRAIDDLGNSSDIKTGDGWTINTELLTTNGAINSMVKIGKKLYIAGSFTAVGQYTGSFVPINLSTNKVEWSANGRLAVKGLVKTIVHDGSGGYYIAGDFNLVGNQPRNNIAHILSDGTLDQLFAPNVTGYINDMILSNSILYLAGKFTSIDGMARSNLAAIDLTGNSGVGTVTSLNPSVIGASVNKIILSGNNLYLGGQFSTVYSTVRNNLASIDLSANSNNGDIGLFNPNVESTVYAMVMSGSILYIGGSFTKVGSTDRYRLAAIDVSGGSGVGALTSFNTGAHSRVMALEISGSTLYVAGDVVNINTPGKYSLAAINVSGTGSYTTFAPYITNTISTLKLVGNILYVGGAFTSVYGEARSGIAGIDLSTETLTTLNVDAFGTYAINVDGSKLRVGGNYSVVGGIRRNKIAAIDVTGKNIEESLTDFNPGADGDVNSLIYSENKLYLGGNFNNINGVSRKGLASFDFLTPGGTPILNSFNPQFTKASSTEPWVKSMVLEENKLIIGGGFNYVNGTPKSYLVALDVTGSNNIGNLISEFNVQPNADVNTLYAFNSKLYISGLFTYINSTARNRLAAIDLLADNGNGALAQLNVGLNSNANSIFVRNNRLYLSGNFTTAGGISRNGFAEIDMVSNGSTGEVASLNPISSGSASLIYLIDNILYLANGVQSLFGNSRNGIGSIDLMGNSGAGAAVNFNPNLNHTVNTIISDDGIIYFGGSSPINGNIIPVDINTSNYFSQ